MAEVLLNYSKVLEVLFPAPDERTIDAARKGLQALGYTKAEAEAWYIPAMALRSNLDVAHISLAQLEQGQLDVLHEYTERAERHFRDLLSRAMEAMESGGAFPNYEEIGVRPDTLKIVERLRKAMAAQDAAGAVSVRESGVTRRSQAEKIRTQRRD